MHRCILDRIGRLHALENVDFTGAGTSHISGIIELFCRCEQITKQIKHVTMFLLEEYIQQACNLLKQSVSLRSIDLTCFDLNNDVLSQVFGAVSSAKLMSISFFNGREYLTLPISLLQPFILNLHKIKFRDCLDLSDFQEMCLQIKMHVCHLKSEGDSSRFLPYQELTLDGIRICQEAAETFAYILAFMKDFRLLKLDIEASAEIVKTIAKSLNRLTNLQSLDLSQTELRDAILDLCNSLKSLSNLRELVLANTSLEESHSSLIGKTLHHLPSLRILDLTGNKIVSAMHDICKGLQNCRIKYLLLNDTCIDDAGLCQLHFRQLKDLQIFNIATKQLGEPRMLYGPDGVEHLF